MLHIQKDEAAGDEELAEVGRDEAGVLGGLQPFQRGFHEDSGEGIGIVIVGVGGPEDDALQGVQGHGPEVLHFLCVVGGHVPGERLGEGDDEGLVIVEDGP